MQGDKGNGILRVGKCCQAGGRGVLYALCEPPIVAVALCQMTECC